MNTLPDWKRLLFFDQACIIAALGFGNESDSGLNIIVFITDKGKRARKKS